MTPDAEEQDVPQTRATEEWDRYRADKAAVLDQLPSATPTARWPLPVAAVALLAAVTAVRRLRR